MTVAHLAKESTRRMTASRGHKEASAIELPQLPPVFRMAMIPTDSGTMGIRWREFPSSDSPFWNGAKNGLLSRIILPGNSPVTLRRLLRPANGRATEVFLPTPRMCRADQFPTWMGSLVELLQGTFSDTTHIGIPASGDNWKAWEPYLDFQAMTDFQKRVLCIVGGIPRGSTLTYGQVAQRSGNPNGARAVGMVMRTNPWPILVPCHRVVGAAGQLTGFSAPGGIDTKRRLLTRENAGSFL